MPKKKPKVLLINFEDLGVGSSGLLVAEALNEIENLDVHCIFEKSMAESPLQKQRLDKIRGMGVKTRRRQHLPWAYLQILFYCLKFRPDVVHDLGGSAFRKNLPLWPFFSMFSRLVFSEYNPEISHSSFSGNLARKLAHRFGNAFLVFGPKSYGDLSCSHMARGKIFQSRLGHKGFYADGLAQKPIRNPIEVLFFGQFRRGKGFDILVPIADLVHQLCPQIKFVVAGSSDMARYSTAWRKQVDTTLQQMRSRPYFEVRDEVIPDAEVAAYFLRAGMVLLPYSEANQSGVMLTAMALNCPVVATAVGDIPSIIRDGENGILSSIKVEALAQAVLSLANDPEFAHGLAQQAKAESEEIYNWSKIVREFPKHVYRLTADV